MGRCIEINVCIKEKMVTINGRKYTIYEAIDIINDIVYNALWGYEPIWKARVTRGQEFTIKDDEKVAVFTIPDC